MQDAIEAMQANEFDPGKTLILDGKVHRFPHGGSRDAGWYGGTILETEGGRSIIAVGYGTWRDAEARYRYITPNIPPKEKKKIEKTFGRIRALREEETAAAQEDTARRAIERWKISLEEGTSEYLERKGIALVSERLLNNVLQIPLRDIDGRLWSLQSIGPDGKKTFMKGGRVKGCFHLLGSYSGSGPLWLCEGYATGVSVHAATGEPVAIAFFSSNLEPVATALVQKYPEIELKVAADDDRFKDPAKNPGRQAAERVADITCAAVFFPVFASDDGAPTDFNDLMLREGIEEVRDQLTEPTVAKKGYAALGFDDTSHYFYSFETASIFHFKHSLSRQDLFHLAPIDSWKTRYRGEKGTDWDQAFNDMIQSSIARGRYQVSRVRGAGVFDDDGRVVVNRGRYLLVNGRKVGMSDIKSKYVYINTIDMPDLLSPLPLADCKKLIDACEWPTWENPVHASLLAGWIAFAPFGGVFNVRPPIWLIAPAGSGKTTTNTKIVEPWLPKGYIHGYGKTTEAGIRGAVSASCVPVLLDEMETAEEDDKKRIVSIIELIRNAYSSSSASVYKGTATGKHISFNAVFTAFVVSINPNAEQERDAGRFTILSMKRDPNNRPDIARLDRAMEEYPVDAAERLFSRTLGMLPKIRKSVDVFMDVLKGNARVAINQAILLAFYYSLTSNDVVSVEEARRIAGDLRDPLNGPTHEEVSSEEQECVAHLIGSHVLVQGTPKPVIRLFGKTAVDDEVKAFKSAGLKIEGDFFYVANKNPQLDRIFKDTPWMNWRVTLKRLPGAESAASIRFGHQVARCVKIPIQSIQSIDLTPEPQQQA